MRLRRYGTFAGGIDLPAEKHATGDSPVRAAPVPESLKVPLAPCRARPAELLVEPGQMVAAGQPIARPRDGTQVPVFAPLAGRVGPVVTVQVADWAGFAPRPALEILDPSAPELPEPAEGDWADLSPQQLRDALAEAGVTTHRRQPRPLARWIDSAIDAGVRTLIANGLEAQPYVTSDHRVLAEFGRETIEGLALIAAAMEVQDLVLGVDARHTDGYRELIPLTRPFGIKRMALPRKYPTGNDTILIKVLTGREVPVGGRPFDVGVAVVGIPTCLAAYRAVAGGAPPLGRVVTVSGERVEQPGNVWVPWGYDCAELLGPLEPPLIHGGPMNGLVVRPGSVVTAATEALLAIASPPHEPAKPCIRCGWCTDHCPARLNVAALNDAFELGEADRGANVGADACVECGICSYVCPARLPLSQRVKTLKQVLAARRRQP